MTLMMLRRRVLERVGLWLALAACVMVLGLGERASAAADDGQVGVVTSEGKVTKRLFWMRVSFADGVAETLKMRGGQTVTYERPDGTFRFVPRVSKKKVGKVEVHAERDTGGAVETAELILSVGEEMDIASEFRELGWPSVAVKVVRVQPPIRRGPNPIDDY